MVNYKLKSEGTDKRVLFVCEMGMLRSPTAARLYSQKYNTRSCGTEEYALIPLTNSLLHWADEIVCMTEDIYNKVKQYGFSWHKNLQNQVIKVLDIPDNYNHMQLELIEELEKQYEPVARFKR